ncbi:hypothetical protein FGO68_gene13083 [Halteria grandinella]|uniref:Glycoside-hydrolase family GH114 TIM-barrel domain-containing protein n=1 Tax=Halteria grandinella TaxID=5974 RepID=A0A8J8NK55_HALGN|nr:hypothetical protein FGO68_gene13083 [Halteria grandinella]
MKDVLQIGSTNLQGSMQLVLRDLKGAAVVDYEMDEVLIDIRSAEKQSILITRAKEAMTLCKATGFQAVVIDNQDSYERSHGLITITQTQELLNKISELAHLLDMSFGQLNSPQLLGMRSKIMTDFAIIYPNRRLALECDVLCPLFKQHYSNRLFVVHSNQQNFLVQCEAHYDISHVLRESGASKALSNFGYNFETCPHTKYQEVRTLELWDDFSERIVTEGLGWSRITCLTQNCDQRQYS